MIQALKKSFVYVFQKQSKSLWHPIINFILYRCRNKTFYYDYPTCKSTSQCSNVNILMSWSKIPIYILSVYMLFTQSESLILPSLNISGFCCPLWWWTKCLWGVDKTKNLVMDQHLSPSFGNLIELNYIIGKINEQLGYIGYKSNCCRPNCGYLSLLVTVWSLYGSLPTYCCSSGS